ncbi:hypothetical protein ABFS82_06G194000 [Erythranthe guttata]|uniref:glutathione transferase n=1 Tax=Erythranthe guttata TaxID=4155 RepID=A0A022RII8_ERYGU|nr:PREDICTED: protein IN2-1 homolog B-like [Erythranthe guttata]EYU39563.1 hypothetical protein MIMGU_mgv1a010823mg [Erythranthe guttata]|eukprot:XP_012834708.1 PREDICTED: protein IN2-1 homolog B-like [Erythranthe guttata]
MATIFNNISYHHSIIHCACNNNNTNRINLCPNLGSPPFKKPLILFPRKNLLNYSGISRTVSAISSGVREEALPPALDSSSDPPPIFDGTPKLYISYSCPFAQRAWITRNCKGLQDTIKLVPINLKNRPSWYKEKVYPPNKVPSLEHNNEVKGESLDLIRYIDANFEGPSLFPDDPTKIEFAEELLSFTSSFSKAVTNSLKENSTNEAGAAFDEIEIFLSKFDDGPFFLGQFSLVDIAYAPFVERYQPFFFEVMSYDITSCRPKLAVWIEEMNKIEAYKQTQRDPKEHVETYRKRLVSLKS